MLAAARKPGRWEIKRSRGFENPLPRTKSPGLAQFGENPGLSNSEFLRGLDRPAGRLYVGRLFRIPSESGAYLNEEGE
jgi:hypothetical protein